MYSLAPTFQNSKNECARFLGVDIIPGGGRGGEGLTKILVIFTISRISGFLEVFGSFWDSLKKNDHSSGPFLLRPFLIST